MNPSPAEQPGSAAGNVTGTLGPGVGGNLGQLAARQVVERVYQSSGSEVPFDLLLREKPCGDDDALADLIDADGRARLASRLDVSLERYLDAVPRLMDRPVVLDAAIDFA